MNVNFVLRRPKVLSIDVTYQCNLRCRMCNAWQLTDKREPLTAGQIVDTVFAYNRQHGTTYVRFLGGEPLLRDDMPEIIAAVSGVMTTELVTNGTLITPDVARSLVGSGLRELRFSIDGPAGIHDWLRGRGTFARAVAGLDAIRAARDELGREHPNLTIWQCVSRASVGSVEHMVEFARSKGAGFSMHFMVDAPPQFPEDDLWGVDKGIRRLVDPSNICLTLKERRQVMVEYYDMLAARDGQGFLASMRARLGGRARVWFNRLGLIVYRDCSRSMHQALINPWGEQFPCEFLHTHVYGHCVTDGPAAWGSDKHVQLRHAVRSGQLAMCRDCNRAGRYRSRHDWLGAPSRLLRREERSEEPVCQENCR